LEHGLEHAAMKITLIAVLAAVALAAQAEDLDVLTLKNGRVLEGHYNAETHNFFFGGGIVGSVQIDPADIVKREKKTLADPGAAAPPAPATPPAGTGTGTPPVATAPTAPAGTPPAGTPPTGAAPPAGAPPADPAQAKRIAAANALKRNQLKRDLQSSEDYQKLYEQNVAKNQADQVDLPKKLDSLRPRIDRARSDYENAQSRYTAVQSDYDWWYGHYRTGTYNGASVSDARLQRDRAELALKQLQDDETKTQKQLDSSSKDMVSNKAKLQSSIDKQVKIKADLDALDAADAAGVLWMPKP
jgi:hypothetical protein